MRKGLLTFAVLTGCVGALTSCQSPVQGSVPVARDATGLPVVHLHFPMVGVFERDEPRSYADVAQFSAETQTPVGIAMYYAAWGVPFNTAFAVHAARHDTVTDVMLEPRQVSVASIAEGHQDKWLRSYAAEIRAFHDPVILSFGHEMNGCWYSWGECKTPPKTFVAAWRHIVTLFRRLKVRNVTWLWAANGSPIKPLRSDYPGNSWVNLVSVTGYYAFPSSTFRKTLASAITAIRKFSDKPMMIGEVGVEPGKDREAQIANLFASARADHVEGIVYFDVNQKHTSAYKQDWRLEGDGAALREFRLAAKTYLARLSARHGESTQARSPETRGVVTYAI